MIELFLLLIGARVVRRKWWILFLLGSVWMMLGAFFFADAFTDSRIPPTWFALPLLMDAAISLFASVHTVGTERKLRIAKAVLFVGIALVLVEAPWHVDMIVGMLAGTFLLADASWRAASAFVVRYAGWRLSLWGAAFEFLLAISSFVPWPTNWAGEAGADVGLLLMVVQSNLHRILGHVPVAGIIPNLVLPLIVFMGVHEYSVVRGASLAFALGYAMDLFGGAPIGLFTFICVGIFVLSRAAGVRMATFMAPL